VQPREQREREGGALRCQARGAGSQVEA
jgi:hypothetical protein